MITILHRGGGSLGTPKSDYVICARPLSSAWAPEVVKNQCLLKLFKVRMSISEQFYKKKHLLWKLDWIGFHYIKLASFHLQIERHFVSQMHVFNLFLQLSLTSFKENFCKFNIGWTDWHSRKVQIRAIILQCIKEKAENYFLHNKQVCLISVIEFGTCIQFQTFDKKEKEHHFMIRIVNEETYNQMIILKS